MQSLFSQGYKGLSDTKFSGVSGSVYRSVGIDHKSEPGLLKVQQRLAKDSASVVDELCKVSLNVSDGSRLWFSSETGKIWRENGGTYTLLGTFSIPGHSYRIDTAQDNNKSFNYSAQVNIPTAHFFKNDGLSLYVMANATVSGNNGEIFQYTLTTAYDITTASYASKKFVADGDAVSMFIKPDGTKLYVCEDGGTTSVIEYNLGTAWDISTASASGDTYDFSAQATRGFGLSFKPDGTEMYISEASTYKVLQYTLSTPWDITSATFTGDFDPPNATVFTYGMYMSADGKNLLLLKSGNNALKYQLSTAWDITSCVPRSEYIMPNADADFAITAAHDGSAIYAGGQSSPETMYQYDLEGTVAADTDVIILGAEEFYIIEDHDDDTDTPDEPVQYIYFATKNKLFREKVSNITTIHETALVETNYFAEFTHKDDEYHPMIVQNDTLYIGDKHVVSSVNNLGTFNAVSDFNVAVNERIVTLEPFDIDVLVGTRRERERDGRVLRWDGISTSWYAEDILPENGGVQAFLKDDNFVYVIGGYKGRMYFYNGGQLEVFKTLPELTGTNQVQVYPNAVGFFQNAPIFGVSHKSGTALLQGVYALGAYSQQYNKVLTLDFPVPTKEFTNVEIGSILVDDTDLYISYKTSTETGIAKLDWDNKYDSAYIETRVLTPGTARHQIKTLIEFMIPYHSLPASTTITMGIKAAYDVSYTNFSTTYDSARLLAKPNRPSIPNVANPQLRVQLGVNSNDAPEIEDILFDIAPMGNR